MKVFLSKRHYNALIKCLWIWGWVYWIMGDMVDEKYKEISEEIDDFKNYILWYHKDFWFDKKNIEEYDNKLSFSDSYMDWISDDMSDFNDMEFWEKLSRKFAIKELEEKHWREQLEEMPQEVFMELLCEVEAKYEKEFEENWFKNVSLFGK